MLIITHLTSIFQQNLLMFYKYFLQKVFLFESQQSVFKQQKNSSYLNTATLWCNWRDSSSHVRKNVHWTFFCSSFSNSNKIFLNNKNSSYLSTATLWCDWRDSSSRVRKNVHWTFFCSSFSNPNKILLNNKNSSYLSTATLWCDWRDSNPRPLGS